VLPEDSRKRKNGAALMFPGEGRDVCGQREAAPFVFIVHDIVHSAAVCVLWRMSQMEMRERTYQRRLWPFHLERRAAI